MDACGCTNRIRCAGHAVGRRDPQPEERIVSSCSLLVEINSDRWFVPFIRMLPMYICHLS